MPEITGLDKHLLRRGRPGWPLLSSTVVSVNCFSPSSIYSSVILNGSGFAGGGVEGWWRARCDGSTKELVWVEMKSLCSLAERSKVGCFLTCEGAGKRKHTQTLINTHLHVCEYSGDYRAQTSLHFVYVIIIGLHWQIWSTKTCGFESECVYAIMHLCVSACECV